MNGISHTGKFGNMLVERCALYDDDEWKIRHVYDEVVLCYVIEDCLECSPIRRGCGKLWPQAIALVM